ncbi:MAG: carbon-nitrogen hydrolase family protein [Pseudodonghicola sp.]
MKLALAQIAPLSQPPQAVLALVADLLTTVASQQVDLLVLPELLLPGYNQPQAHAALSQPQGGDWVQQMAQMARQAGCAIAFGWAERRGDEVFNAATVIDPAGEVLAHYRKIQLFGPMERASFAPGTEAPPVFDYRGRRFGLLICYDIEFPEHGRSLARRGAEVALVPTANPAGYEHVQRLLVPARAYENRMTVVYANYCGPEGDLTFGGGSVIAGPDGQVVAAAGLQPACLIVDLPEAGSYRADLLSTQLDDLRDLG